MDLAENVEFGTNLDALQTGARIVKINSVLIELLNVQVI